MLGTIFTTLIFLVTMCAIVWFYYLVHKKIVGESYIRIYEPVSFDDVKYVFFNLLILISSMLAVSVLFGFIIKNFGNQLALVSSVKDSPSWVFYFYVLLFSPIFETVIISGLLGEIIAWWFIKMSLAKRTPLDPMLTSLILTGFVYGSIHAAAASGFFDYLLSMIVYGFFGAFLTYMNLKSQDIRMPVVTHILYNSISLSVLLLTI